MKKFMLFEDYSIDKVYDCSPLASCSGFTKLMVLVMNTKNNMELNNDIHLYKDIINEKNEYGWTALMLACRNSSTYSSIETVQLLLKYGADVNLADVDGWTPLMMASKYSNTDSSIENVQLLLDYGADVHLKNSGGWNAFLYVCRNANTSNIETIQLLLDHGVDVNFQDRNNTNALIIACRYNNIKIIPLLLDHNANVNLCNDDRMTALMYSCINNQIDITQLLLDHGADVNLCNDDRMTALMYACNRNNIRIVQLLLKYNVDVNLQNADGCTALIMTVGVEVAKLLLDHGANIHIKNVFKKTVYMTASDDIKKLILSYYNIESVCNDEVIIGEIDNRIKIERFKCRSYDRCLKFIPEQDAKIRFKQGNMGYKISMYQYKDNITQEETDELLSYLSATPFNLHEKINEYLDINC